MAKNNKTDEVCSGKVRVQIYVPEAQQGKEITLTKDQIRHLKVLRIQDGELIHIFDGKGTTFEVIYSEKVSSGKIKLDSTVNQYNEPNVAITLATAVPKGERMDTLVEKVSELGVTNIVPIICSRSVVKPHDAKIERLRKIAMEAACQSKRSIVPIISDVITFAELLDKVKQYNHALICHKTGQRIEKEYGKCKSVLIIIGPEGDFTEAELEAALEAGCKKVSLGNTILRTETAAITSIAQIIAQDL